MTFQFAEGLGVELRFASAEEYAIHWVWGDAELRIDTAPLHPGLATFPNHLHDHRGDRRADPLTVPGRDPWQDVERVLEALLADQASEVFRAHHAKGPAGGGPLVRPESAMRPPRRVPVSP